MDHAPHWARGDKGSCSHSRGWGAASGTWGSWGEGELALHGLGQREGGDRREPQEAPGSPWSASGRVVQLLRSP